jgi:hypothetical protein
MPKPVAPTKYAHQEYPKVLFKLVGKTIEQSLVKDPNAHDAAKAEGWCESQDEAVAFGKITSKKADAPHKKGDKD